MNNKPVIPLHRLNGLQRTAESFHHVAPCIERWISPAGHLRCWMKHNARLAMYIGVPTFLTFPIITIALWEIETWVNSLTTIAGKLIVLPILLLLALVSITVFRHILRVFKP